MITGLHIGDCEKVLESWPDECVDLAVTSPPYWGMRDYGAEGQFGMEPTLEEYLDRMARIFDEVRRVLRADGTLWLNIGDSYCNDSRGRNPGGGRGQHHRHEAATAQAAKRMPPGCKPKDMLGLPWEVAFTLRWAGWYLRSEIIWEKTNALPESVGDRPTKATESIFLLSKSETYYFDGAPLAEPLAHNGGGGGTKDRNRPPGSSPHLGLTAWTGDVRNGRNIWRMPTASVERRGKGCHPARFPEALAARCILAGSRPGGVVLDPFAGEGTTARVAEDLGRRWAAIEINPEYADAIQSRMSQVGIGALCNGA